MIPVGSYAPDIADTNPGVATQANNVLLSKGSAGVEHGPMPGLAVSESATALPASPKGGASVVDSSGSYFAFVGTASNIYKMTANYELDATTSVGSSYSLPSGDHWGFARFGAYLHATNVTDGLQKFDVDSDSAFSAVSDAPAARYAFPAFNALFLLDCDGDNRVMRNSALGNSLIWEGKGAQYQVFESGEELLCGAELSQDFAIVLQRNAINGLFRRSDGRLYDKKVIAKERGAVSPKAFCSVDGRAFWADTDGFWMYSVGQGLQNIGFNRINKTFTAGLSADGLSGVEMAVDKVNNRIAIRYRASDDASETVFGHLIYYWYLIDEWSTAEVDTTAILNMATPGHALDDIDFLGDADSITTDADSRFWAGGEPRIAALNADLKFGFFDGDALASTSETSSIQDGRSKLITSITPLTDAENASVAVGYRNRAADAITWKSGVTIKASGRCPIRARGKLHAFKQTVAAGESWSYLRGFDYPEFSEGGPR